MIFVFSQSSVVFAQQSVGVNILVVSPSPEVSIVSTGGDSLDVKWNWDFVSPGYLPPSVTEMQVEISSDSVNYFGFQSHSPSDFSASYSGLSAGSYVARVVMVDGNNFSYAVGPVVLSGASSGRRHAPPPILYDVSFSGLAYPGPASVVVVNTNNAFQTVLSPDSFGNFSGVLSGLAEGTVALRFSVEDQFGTLSTSYDVSLVLEPGANLTLTGLNLAPTINAKKNVLLLGEPIELFGYGYKDGAISLLVDGVTSLAALTQADVTGYWSVDLASELLSPGTYSISAQSTSSDGSVISMFSDQIVIELTSPLPSVSVCGDSVLEGAETCDDGNVVNGDGCSSTCDIEVSSVCGNSVLEGVEECDDGNLVDGDACSSLCFLESSLPFSSVIQPVNTVFSSPDIQLAYQADSPLSLLVTVDLYYSIDGGSYVILPGVYSGGVMNLTGLVDGSYSVYSIAKDSDGRVESAPAVPDATFIVKAVRGYNLLVYPGNRSPSTGNWSLDASLDIYPLASSNPLYSYDVVTNDDGELLLDFGSSFVPGVYRVLLKGESHLSKRLDNVDMMVLGDLLLDFTSGGQAFLTPGDVHPSKDDFINALDISSVISSLYSADRSADLNRDGFVNGMELSILIRGLYQSGDGVR